LSQTRKKEEVEQEVSRNMKEPLKGNIRTQDIPSLKEFLKELKMGSDVEDLLDSSSKSRSGSRNKSKRRSKRGQEGLAKKYKSHGLD